ncbi:hypothetical protein THASP1DRAFT_31975 [Thamnocephalis sphaerospora]|uniref:RING-type E3 ubiquitin transferase n=1 Tax=Thamnocephalis sphaerospora TaxID=78915 RepID=A0A4V1IW38_9FUNG|nr:hypothetical protein THASP1DRAFT_31975 [Thamnocephalis sphaerospora]|eukprot:RKP06209.1 hypothetical protein THASP1DRAFT_31975 [Thamnocephalis sphaerospora]
MSGASALVYGYVRYGRPARRLGRAKQGQSLAEMQQVLAQSPAEGDWFKMHGRVHCPNPVMAPLSGLACAYVDVTYARRHMHRRKLHAKATPEERRRQERRERRRWSKQELNAGGCECFHERLSAPWTLQIKSGDHVVVDMNGSQLELEQIIDRHTIQESVLRNDAPVLVLGRVRTDLSGDVLRVGPSAKGSRRSDGFLITTRTEHEVTRALHYRWAGWSAMGVGLLGCAAAMARWRLQRM